ncbi:MAG: Uma2 family endonuclease [Syntrophobacteraceae bacterium]|nr:Uma2 family endonuclease [Syntrophobacteraceae bacterium]
MEWREVVEHPSLQDLPFKIETNAEGYIMMVAAKNRHRLYQARIHVWFEHHGEENKAMEECNIQTSDGAKIADVAWRSLEFIKRNKDSDPYQESPEIVVEVISPSYREKAMKSKMSLYFEKEAKEVWFCDDDGNMGFFNPQGELERNELFKEFPGHIDIEVG